MFKPSLDLLWSRLLAALTTVPDLDGWILSAKIFLAYAAFALVVGLSTRFIYDISIPEHWRQLSLRTLITPALTEEILFRVLVLPHPQESYPLHLWWIWGSLSLILFILYHPLNGFTLFRAGYSTFWDLTFLLLAGSLGLICTLLYMILGSLWPVMAIHWFVVWVWLCLLGGAARFQPLNR